MGRKKFDELLNDSGVKSKKKSFDDLLRSNGVESKRYKRTASTMKSSDTIPSAKPSKKTVPNILSPEGREAEIAQAREDFTNPNYFFDGNTKNSGEMMLDSMKAENKSDYEKSVEEFRENKAKAEAAAKASSVPIRMPIDVQGKGNQMLRSNPSRYIEIAKQDEEYGEVISALENMDEEDLYSFASTANKLNRNSRLDTEDVRQMQNIREKYGLSNDQMHVLARTAMNSNKYNPYVKQYNSLSVEDKKMLDDIYYLNTELLANLDNEPTKDQELGREPSVNPDAWALFDNKRKLEEKYGKDAVKAFIQLNKAENGKWFDDLIAEQEKQSASVGEGVAGSVASVGLNLAGGMMAPIAMVDAYINTKKNKKYGLPSDGTLDTSGSLYALTKLSNTARTNVTNSVDWNVDLPFFGETDVFDFLYNTGMSGVDSITAALTGNTGIAALSGTAALNSSIDTAKKGTSAEQSLITAMGAAAYEYIFEKISIGNLKGWKEVNVRKLSDFLKNLAKSTGVNASEESLTEAANMVTDFVVNRDKSDFSLGIKEYENQGFSRTEAVKMAILDGVKRIGEAGASGALMGVGFSAVGSTSSFASNRNNAKAIGKSIKSNGLTDAVVEAARTSEDELVQEYVQTINQKGKDKASDADIGMVAQELMKGGETTKSALDTISSYTRKGKSSETQLDEYTKATVNAPKIKVDGKELTLDGKNFDSKTESFGKFKGITENASGEKVIETTDGTQIKLSEAVENMTDEIAKALYKATEGMTTAQANLFISEFNGETIDEYKKAADYYYKLGSAGLTAERIAESDSGWGEYLTEQARNCFANLGASERELKIGLVDMTVKKKTLSEKIQLYALNEIAKTFGNEIMVVDDIAGINGVFRENTNRIIIGRNSDQGLMTAVFGHESFHEVENYNSEAASELIDFTIKALKKEGVDIDAEIQKLRERGYAEERYTREQVLSEIAANNMYEVFSNEAVIKEYALKNHKVLSTLVKVIDKAVKAINTALGRYQNSSADSSMLIKDKEALATIRTKMLKAMEETKKNRENAQNTEQTQKNTSEEVKEKNKYSFAVAKDNKDIVELINKVKNGQYKDNEKVKLGTISEKAAKEIYRILGVDVKDYKIAIEARQIFHILNDHGENGKADHSMSDDADIAKIEFVLNNFDRISYSGKTQAYSYMRDGANRTAETVLYEKDIGNKSYYVVQAVPIAKKKTLYIVSAFIGPQGYKNGALQLINTSKGPNATAKPGSVITPNNSISNHTSKVKLSMKNAEYKQNQLDIINETNPAPNTYSTWIRTVDDIKTLSETLEDEDWEYEEINPDLTRTDIQSAIENGKITVYSSYPIRNGVFVSPSRMEAESYSGNGKVYEKTVDINDVAWIDPTQGQYAKVDKTKGTETYSHDNSKNNTSAKITRNMSDEERAKILKNKRIKNIIFAKNLSEEIEGIESVSSWDEIDKISGKEKRSLIQKIAKEFGAFKEYINDDVSLSFVFSNNNYRESYGKQKKNFQTFAKMFSVFDQVIESAVGVEVHNRNDEGYKYDLTLKDAYVLISAFGDGNSIVPVKLEVKEFNDKENTLYVAVALETIKMTEVSKQGTTKNGVAQNSRSVNISIADLLPKINSKDVDFLKYIPDSMLSAEQIASKNNSKSEALWSLKSDSSIQAHYAEVARENRNLREIINLFDEQGFSSARGKVELSSERINLIAKSLLKNYSSKYDTDTFADEIKVVYDYMANAEELNTDDVLKGLLEVSNRVLEQSGKKDTELWDQYKDVRDYLRTQPILITENVKKEIISTYGSYKSYRNLLMGKVNRLSTTNTDAMILDEVWQELSEMAPEFFSKDTNELDMPLELAAFYDAIAPQIVNPYEINLEDAAVLLSTDILSEYENNIRLNTTDQKYKNLLWENKRKMTEHRKALEADFKKKKAENKQEQIDNYKKRVIEFRQQKEAGERRRVLRNTIERNYNYLNRRLTKETDKEHIPEEYKPLVTAFKDIIPDKASYFSKTKFIAFVNEYRKLEGVSVFFDEDMPQKIENLAARLMPVQGAPKMRELDIGELNALQELTEHIKHIVKQENTLFSDRLKGQITSYAQAAHGEMQNKGESRIQGTTDNSTLGDKTRHSVDSFIKGLTKPEYLFESLGSKTLKKLYDEIRRGENVEARIISDAREKELGIKKANNYDTRWEHQTVSIKLLGGELNITVEQLMSLYASSKRHQSREHMLNGGVIIHTKKQTDKRSVNKRERFYFKEQDVLTIEKALTADQKNYVNAMVEYITKDIGAKRNEISMRLLGIEKYKEEYYFPIKVDKHFLDSNLGKVEVVSTIKNQGSSKRVTQKAHNPIEIGGFTDTVNDHIYDSALYCAYVLPVEDFRRVYNYRDKVSVGEGVESLIMRDISIKEDIRRTKGINAIKEIENFMVALDSGSRYENVIPLSAKLAARAKKTSVMANLSVVVQQPTAVFRSMLYVNPKYFATVASKSDIAEMKKWNGCALKKEIGYFDVNMGRTATDFISEYHTDKAIKKDWNAKDYLKNIKGNTMQTVDEVAGWGASKADEITWGAIWKACKKQVKAENKNLSGDELNAQAAELFQKVITKTQVYDSVFTKPEYMRRKEGFSMMATQFMSEPLTSLNMLAESVAKAKNAPKNSAEKNAAQKHCTRAFACYLTSIVVNAACKSIIYTIRDDDEDKSFLEKYVANVLEGIVTDPIGMIPYVKDILSLVQGYDLNRIDVAAFSSFKDAIDSLGSDNKTPFDKIMAVLKAAGQASGIPFYSVMRDGKALLNTFNSIVDGIQNGFEPTTSKGIINELQEVFDWVPFIDAESNYEQLYSSLIEGDTEHYDKVYENLIEEGKGEKTITSNIVKQLKDAYSEGSITETELKSYLYKYKDDDEDENDIFWKVEEIKAGDEHEKYGKLYNAVDNGAGLDSAISYYASHGVEITTIRSNITKKYKPKLTELPKGSSAYNEMYDNVIDALVATGKTESEAIKQVNKWFDE